MRPRFTLGKITLGRVVYLVLMSAMYFFAAPYALLYGYGLLSTYGEGWAWLSRFSFVVIFLSVILVKLVIKRKLRKRPYAKGV